MDFIRNKGQKADCCRAVFLFYFGAALALSLIAKLYMNYYIGYHFIKCSFLFFTYQRYKKIADFSLHIDRLLHGDETISFCLGHFQKANYLFYMMKYLR